MRKFLQKLLNRQVIALANKWSTRPDQGKVDKALTDLYRQINSGSKKGLVINLNADSKFVVLSDQHKGARDGADIFAAAEKNYLAALAHYYDKEFFYINLGDSEELWENIFLTIKKYNQATFNAERKFLERKAFVKIFGNHDLYWDNDPLAELSLESVYGQKVNIYEGLILRSDAEQSLDIYMTHGHQGDLQSDGNWFSKWFVSDIWGPFQSYLRINPNTPANNDQLKTDHNRIMYEWSVKQQNLLLITGHTHQPVFRSLTQLESLYEKLAKAQTSDDTIEASKLQYQINDLHLKTSRPPDFKGYLDTYFNSGCCCFDDGDITGIEIEDDRIRLIRWKYSAAGLSVRAVLEECKLADLKLS